jgi:hypothetical protein
MFRKATATKGGPKKKIIQRRAPGVALRDSQKQSKAIIIQIKEQKQTQNITADVYQRQRERERGREKKKERQRESERVKAKRMATSLSEKFIRFGLYIPLPEP